MLKIETLTIEQKIGQMLCLGWMDEGYGDACLRVNDQARRCVTELHAGGMILFSRNVQVPGDPMPPIDTALARDMIAELQRLTAIPLFVAVDQEGGRVARLGAPFTPLPPAKNIGQTKDASLAASAARITGRELRAVGINFNFAPVADINSNRDNQVIGDRAFGDTPETVSAMVSAQVDAYRAGDILSCAKHFPGHGDTHLDSHFDLPTIEHALEVMNQRELLPFLAAIEAGVRAIMTAHILFPALDATGVPATLSEPILTNLLRNELGFDGLVVTDCLQMKAVTDTWGTAKAAVMAAKAGADILLVCHTWEEQEATFDALVAAANSGELSETRINESVARILHAKIGLPTREMPAISVIGSPEHMAAARRIFDAAGIPFAEPLAAPTLGESLPDRGGESL